MSSVASSFSLSALFSAIFSVITFRVIFNVVTPIFAIITDIVLQGNLYESRGRTRDVGANISNVDITNIEHLEVTHFFYPFTSLT